MAAGNCRKDFDLGAWEPIGTGGIRFNLSDFVLPLPVAFFENLHPPKETKSRLMVFDFVVGFKISNLSGFMLGRDNAQT